MYFNMMLPDAKFYIWFGTYLKVKISFKISLLTLWPCLCHYGSNFMKLMHIIGAWTRLYFLSFNLISLVVSTIIVAFMLEAFLFKIEYKNKTKQDGILTDVKKVILNKDDVKFLKTLYESDGKSLKRSISR